MSRPLLKLGGDSGDILSDVLCLPEVSEAETVISGAEGGVGARMRAGRRASNPSSPSPTDAVRDGSAKLGPPVQNVTREHGLTPLPR